MVMHRGTAADPPSLDPTLAAGTLAAPVIADLFVGLLTKDPASRPVPGCAESWEVSEDGVTYTFRLRRGLRWSDGAPLGADDFVYSFRRLIDPQTASDQAGPFLIIENARAITSGELPPERLGVSAPDAATVVIRLEQPAPYFLEMLGNLQVAPVPRHAIEQHGREWTRPGRMVSNGPYVLNERVPQTHIKLVRNAQFFAADDVRIDEVYWYPTQDLGTSLRRFRAGELDQVLNFPPSELEALLREMPEVVFLTPSLGQYFLVPNMRRPPFDDVRVRKAVSIALDREAITDRLLRNGVTPAWTYLGPDFENYPGIRLADQSLPLAARQAEARRLLAEAGYTAERPLVIRLTYDTQEENRKVAVALAGMWQAIGARTEITNVDFGNLNRQVRTKNFDLARWAFFASFDDAYAFLQVLESDRSNNWPGYRNPEYDQLLKRANREQDATVRAALLADAEQLMMADYPLIPVFNYVRRYLVATRVKGWVTSPRGPTPTRYLSLE